MSSVYSFLPDISQNLSADNLADDLCHMQGHLQGGKVCKGHPQRGQAIQARKLYFLVKEQIHLS